MHHAPVIMPSFAHFAATANVRHRRNHAAINHAEDVRVEADVVWIPIGAIAGQIQRTFSIELGALQVDDSDWNLYAIGGRRKNPLHTIPSALIAAGHFFLLQQLGSTVRAVVFEYRLRRNERLVAVAKLNRIVFTIEVWIVDIGR